MLPAKSAKPARRRHDPHLGDIIANARIERGISQRELGVLTGIPASLLGNYEGGHREPGLHALLLIAQALDVPLSGLLSPLDDVPVPPWREGA